MKTTVKIIQISKEVNIDTDFELMLPDFYVKFYGRKTVFISKLAEIQSKEKLQKFENELIDRFGNFRKKPLIYWNQ